MTDGPPIGGPFLFSGERQSNRFNLDYTLADVSPAVAVGSSWIPRDIDACVHDEPSGPPRRR
jgi:hypothetical protein